MSKAVTLETPAGTKVVVTKLEADMNVEQQGPDMYIPSVGEVGTVVDPPSKIFVKVLFPGAGEFGAPSLMNAGELALVVE